MKESTYAELASVSEPAYLEDLLRLAGPQNAVVWLPGEGFVVIPNPFPMDVVIETPTSAAE